MRAVEIRKFGAPEGLAVIDLPSPVPAAGEVLIDVEAIGVGGVDTVIRSGALGGFGFQEGFIPGNEIAGTVTSVGDDVDPSWAGRRVWAFTGEGGGYVERAAIPVEKVVPLPENLPADAAVAVGTSGMVAHFALAHAHFAPGESVLVRGAAGSIGIMTVQLAAAGGASAVAVTTSSAARGERLREVGATHVLDRSGDGEGPAGYDVVIDIVSGVDMPSFIDRLAPNGRLVTVGVVAGMPPADFGAKLLTRFRESLSVAAFSADSIPEADRRAVTTAQFDAAAQGELRPVVHELLPLEKAVLAHRKMDDGEVFGRIVLTP
ncbi:zinc-binding dehydrogenase [Amycolatopsis oliviviridis]|uniref:Oxidoreductase n=1 Tax=Amycolatopsis oliviviridis TaxID=1471590 RepID=A0ABQ3M6C5_9PSEU|nr:zinc-binding dehydrogenase [Amycolatopsis oliviviridis]GHH34809.1 oxidoreductase [Amycolatopsis oliviviridis]